MEPVYHQLAKFIEAMITALSNGLDVYETLICIAGIADVAFIIWVIAWASVKISYSLLETIRELIKALENVITILLEGIRRGLKKLNEFGREAN